MPLFVRHFVEAVLFPGYVHFRSRETSVGLSCSATRLSGTDAEACFAFPCFGGVGSHSTLFGVVRIVKILSDAGSLYTVLPELVAPQFQWRISGMSSPYLPIYCLCSTSLSLSCCFR
jgi:hypothetical protein